MHKLNKWATWTELNYSLLLNAHCLLLSQTSLHSASQLAQSHSQTNRWTLHSEHALKIFSIISKTKFHFQNQVFHFSYYMDLGRFHEKKLLFFWILSKWGGGCQKFFVTFSEVHFWSIKGVHFLQNANNLNFKLFFRLYTWPTNQVFCLY